MIKEFLKQNNIPAGNVQQRVSRAQRWCKKKVDGTNVTIPMFPTTTHEKKKVQQRIDSGDIALGNEVVPSCHYYSVNSDTQVLQANKVRSSGRKIPLLQIWEKLLQKHEKLGVVRPNNDEYFSNLSEEEIRGQLDELNIPHKSSDNIRQ